MELGVRIGLGTDVSGGASPSLLHTVHEAVTVSRILADGVDPARPADERGVPGSAIDTTFGFWLATLGGAELLGARSGCWHPAAASTRSSSTRPSSGSLRVFPEIDTPERVFEKVVRLAGPPDFLGVWVDGRQVVTDPANGTNGGLTTGRCPAATVRSHPESAAGTNGPFPRTGAAGIPDRACNSTLATPCPPASG